MAEDDSALASKILLRHAANKNKAKSWLIASLGAEEIDATTADITSEVQASDALDYAKYNDENAGIGTVRKDGSEDQSNRQPMGANEALRRKLLSKDAYKKYSEGKKTGTMESNATYRGSGRKADSDDGDESKGRSGLGERNSRTDTTATEEEDGILRALKARDDAAARFGNSTVKQSKKRPASYLDQVLAKRQQKESKKTKRTDGNE